MSAASVLPIATGRETARTAMRLLRRHRAALALTVLLLLGGSTAGLFLPRLLGGIVDRVAASAGVPSLVWPALGLLGATVLAAGLGYAGIRILVAVVQKVVAELREDAVAVVLALPAAIAESSNSSDIVSRVTRDVEAVTEAASGILPTLTQAAFTVGVSLVGIAVIDWRLGLAALLAIPLQLWGTLRFLRASKPVYAQMRVAEAERGQAILESVTGADTLRAHRRQEQQIALTDRLSRVAIELEREAMRLRTRFFGWLNAGEFVGVAAILATGFLLVQAGSLSIGGATAATLTFLALFGPIGSLLYGLDELQRTAIGLARLVGVVGMRSRAMATELAPPASLRGVEIAGVRYSHDGRVDHLIDVSLHIDAGERVALVGRSGSGKSTLAQLIVGTAAPLEGSVALGGRAAAEAENDQRVMLVTQEMHVFDGTIADNLRLASPRAGDEELERALRAVGGGWMLALDGGLESAVGASGSAFDGAAAQQLALARVLLRDPHLVVFDEATAEGGGDDPLGLDAALSVAAAGRTAVVVAHRLSQARDADRIVVLANGRVTEDGAHEELLARGGEYARLWAAWDSSAATAPSAPAQTPPARATPAPSAPASSMPARSTSAHSP